VRAVRGGGVSKTPIGLVSLVMWGALALWGLGTLALLPLDARAACGMAVGGGIGLGTLALYRALVKAWVRPDRWRRGRFVLAGIWLVKWPVLGALLYLALKEWRVSPVWVCVGVGLVPAVVTAVAVWAHVTPDWQQKATLEME